MYPVYGLHETLASIVEADAIRAGERSRIILELRQMDQEPKRSMRRRLASTLIQLGVKIDPLAAKVEEAA